MYHYFRPNLKFVFLSKLHIHVLNYSINKLRNTSRTNLRSFVCVLTHSCSFVFMNCLSFCYGLLLGQLVSFNCLLVLIQISAIRYTAKDRKPLLNRQSQIHKAKMYCVMFDKCDDLKSFVFLELEKYSVIVAVSSEI